jgi:putative hydrolase of the HAD superfamily
VTTAVHFDLDGTLLEFTRPYGTFVAATLSEHLGTAPDDLIECYNEAFFERFAAFDPAPVSGGMRAVLDRAREEGVLDGREPDAEEMVATLRAQEYDGTRVPDGLPALLDRLADGGCRLGVVTNGLPEWQSGKLERHDLATRFDSVITSYAVDAHKPDPAVFEAAAERLPADRHVMIGDDREADVQGARGAGWDAVHVDGTTGVRAGSVADLATTLSLADPE